MNAAGAAAVRSAGALFDELRQLRTGAPGFTTTLFAAEAQVEAWARRGVLSRVTAPGCILLLRRDRALAHLYHWAASREALDAALASLPGTGEPPLVADLVDRAERVPQLSALYARHGFARYATLVRMARVAPAGAPAAMPPDVEVAGPADTADVHAFFERLLDPVSMQVPELEEIAEAIAQRSVLVVRRGAALGGVLVFQLQGQSAILRYWWVHERARDQGIGARLMRGMFAACASARRTVLWVLADNDDAIRKYEHYGFGREGLVDEVMLRPGSENR